MPHMNNTAHRLATCQAGALGVVPHHNLVSLQYYVMWLWGDQNRMMVTHVILGCCSFIKVTRKCRRVGIVMLYLQNNRLWQSERRSSHQQFLKLVCAGRVWAVDSSNQLGGHNLCFQTAQMLQQTHDPQST